MQKKLKKKSIFSPENSSESDSGIATKANSTKPINSNTKYAKNQQSKPKANDAKQKVVVPNRSSTLLPRDFTIFTTLSILISFLFYYARFIN